jgi:hypothetical protein
MKEIKYAEISESPQDFLRNRTIMNSLGKGEAEEILSRILRFCLQQNRWVAPTPQELDAQVEDDFAQIRENDEIRNRNWERRRAYEKASKWNWLRKLVGRQEVHEPEYEEEKPEPFTFLTIYPDATITGFRYMMEHGFLKIEEENGERFLRATEKALLAMPIVD